MSRCRCNTFFAVLCLIPFALLAFAQTSASPSQWNSLVDDFLDQELFPNNPTLATQLGVHDFDAKLEDFSRNGIARHIAGLKKFEARTVALDPKGLSQMETADREMLLSAIRSELFAPGDSHLGKRSGHLLERCCQQHLRDYEPQFCIGGQSPALRGCA